MCGDALKGPPAHPTHEKVVKTAPTHSLSPATTVCPIGYAKVMLASLFDPLKTNQVLLGCFWLAGAQLEMS